MPDYYELNGGDVFTAAEQMGEARAVYRWSVMKYARRAFCKDLQEGCNDLKKLAACAQRWLAYEEERRR